MVADIDSLVGISPKAMLRPNENVKQNMSIVDKEKIRLKNAFIVNTPKLGAPLDYDYWQEMIRSASQQA